MFKRFHRIENSAGRTYEGTGIGLSLVHELVQLHSGEITLTSTLKSGSAFFVKIPSGRAHLPQEQVFSGISRPSDADASVPFLREAFSLLQNESVMKIESDFHPDRLDPVQHKGADIQTRILIVDDNSDMRAYLERLLEPFFTVETASNGKEAFERVRLSKPSLVLSDMMMPVMDGKEMLSLIRKDEELSGLPVIFLSARAGEEARIDGLEAGADDYLVKPFSAAELLSKVRAQININKARGHAEEQLRNLLTEAPVAMAIYRGANHVIELANERMLNLWGKSRSETFKKPLLQAIPDLKDQGFGAVMDKVYQSGERYVSTDLAITLTRNEKREVVSLNLTIEALRDENGLINGLIAVAADVTEQMAARQELIKVKDTLLLAMDSSNMGFYRITVADDHLEVSPRGRQIHAIDPETELNYSATLEVVVAEDRERFSQAIAMAIETKSSFSIDYQIQPFDGSKRRWINSTGKAELNSYGAVISVVGTLFDITEFKEDELRKNDFIGMVSHELKTPLSSISGYAQMGHRKSQKLGDELSASVYSRIEQQTRRMTSLINGFLNVSRLDSGKIVLNPTKFLLDDAIRLAVSEIQMIAPGQLFEIISEPIIVVADQDKITTVITNFLSNAAKYAKDKKVTVRCYKKDSVAIVSVQDEGPGIKSTELGKLFDRYYRVEGTSQNISGFGIGLYLSSEIIHRHGGEIWAESEPGLGATFLFTLPI